MLTKQLNSGVVTAIAEDDLVTVCDEQGVLKPIAFVNFMKAVREDMGLSKSTNITLNGGEWVRIAKTTYGSSTFEGMLAVTHSWTSGKPCPLVCFINGSASNADGFFAEQLTKDSFYAPSTTSNQFLSFTALRFVVEDDARYIEVKFKDNSKITALYVALSCNHGLALLPASISTVSSDKVLKTIEFTRGGVIGCYAINYNSVKKGGAHDDQDTGGSAGLGADCHLAFESIDDVCRFIGESCEDQSDCSDSADSDMRGCGFSDSRLVTDDKLHTQPTCLGERRIRVHGVLGYQCKDAGVLPVPRRSFQMVPPQGEQSMGGLDEVSVRELAERKEVAYAG